MLRRPALRIPAWLLALAFFAGCMDNPLPEASEAEAGALPGVPSSTGLTASTLGYAGPEHFMSDRWENGTYMATDSGWPLGGPINMVLQDRRAERVFDITDDLPVGIPAMVMLELDASERGGGAWPQSGNVAVGMRMDAMDFIGREGTTTYGGEKEVHFTVQRLSGEPILVVVFYGPLDPSVEITYSLHITIMGSADIVQAGAVVALDLAPGDTLVLEPVTELPEVTLFDALDNFIGRYVVPDRTEIRVPPSASEGEFVLVTQGDGAALRVSALRNATGELRPIGFEWIQGVEKAVSGAGVTWEEEVDRPIVATGMWIHGTDQPFRCYNVQGSVIAPDDDKLFTIDNTDSGCAGAGPFGWEIWVQTINGLSAVREGTYTMEVKAPESVGLVAQQWYLHYVR